jgi:phosphatidylinositol phospholipase C delta
MSTVDVYDGEDEPVIYHGKTWTSKVSLREVCMAIAKYAFVASPYPIIISAEVHCGLKQQDVLVNIMTEVFGDALIRSPIEGRPKIENLPSPEDLKGRFLLKVRHFI